MKEASLGYKSHPVEDGGTDNPAFNHFELNGTDQSLARSMELVCEAAVALNDLKQCASFMSSKILESQVLDFFFGL